MSNRPVSTAMTRPSLLAVASLVAWSMVIAGAVRPSPALAVDGATFVQLANLKRAGEGKPPVALSGAVDTIAIERANAMASTGSFVHDGAYIERRLRELGVCYSSYGEIIYWEGYASFSVQRAIDTWWASSTHHAIMAGDSNAAGGSWAKAANGRYYAAMIFAKLCVAPPPPSGDVSRLAGPDRYATVAEVSEATFAPGVPVAYVATGTNFPDALAGSAAAARRGGPVLLVTGSGIPSATAAELVRLAPQRIVVLGGSSVVSDGVRAALAAYTSGPVERVAGADRYATAAAVSASTFSPGVSVAYVATGENFPDALAGGAAAGKDRGPILLVRRDRVPDATAAELARLRPQTIVVLGSSGVVSDAVADQLRAFAGSVLRASGADRYATGVAVSRLGYGSGSVDALFVATGQVFPDGLAGGPAAALVPGPLLLTASNSLPSVVADEIRRLNPDRVYVLGSSGAVSDGVAAAIASLLD